MKKQYKLLTPTGIVLSDTPGKYAGWEVGKIFGRLDCKSGMKMKRKNRVFFRNFIDAIDCGYRPCKKCKPWLIGKHPTG